MSLGKRNYSSAFFYQPPAKSRRGNYSSATPMSMVSSASNSRSNNRYNSRRYGYRRSGPYNALTAFSGHINPIYPRAEIKFVDNAQNGMTTGSPPLTPMPVAGAAIYLFNIAQGVTQSQRVGLSVNVKSMTYRFEVALTSTTVTSSGRVVILWDKQPLAGNNASNNPAWTDIFSFGNYLSFMNPQNTQRFTILRNQQFSLSDSGDKEMFFEGYIKINMLSTYTQTFGNPVSGSIVLAYISDGGSGGTNPPTLAFQSRLRYTDS